MNSVFSFNKYTKKLFLAAGLMSDKFSFCPKNNGFARVPGGGAAAPPAPWLVPCAREPRWGAHDAPADPIVG